MMGSGPTYTVGADTGYGQNLTGRETKVLEDCEGTELQIGDEVVTIQERRVGSSRYRHPYLHKGYIDSFTPKKIKVLLEEGVVVLCDPKKVLFLHAAG